MNIFGMYNKSIEMIQCQYHKQTSLLTWSERMGLPPFRCGLPESDGTLTIGFFFSSFPFDINTKNSYKLCAGAYNCFFA